MTMYTANCKVCHQPIAVGEEDVEVTCGSCTQHRALLVELEQEKWQEKFTPQVLIQFRDDRYISQAELARRAGVPVYIVGRVERGEELCPLPLANYLDKEIGR